MAHVKKLVIHGFKSFANKTELPFDTGINTIIGPNGSGKSNISDALCFVLGRISSKSMRAAKTSNLIFQGTREKKPGAEASVELIFDNSDKTLNFDSEEVSIKRVVRRQGSSIYKINGDTKTRQEILEILGSGGIDANGFNIVLQGEIAKFVKMRSEDRREIIEEIAGISIYETRKAKALREIEKTEQKLKEVSAVLRERTSYLKNLEAERKQALRYKELEKTIKQCKATIIKKKTEEKIKSLKEIDVEITKNQNFKTKIKSEIEKSNEDISKIESRIEEINKYIQKTTGLERENLNEEVTVLNSQIAAASARKENFEKKLTDNDIRSRELRSNLEEYETELEELKKESPKISKKQEEIKIKKQELEKIGNEREKLYSVQTEINTIDERIRDKQKLLDRTKLDSKEIVNTINLISESLSSKDLEECENKISEMKSLIETKISELNNFYESKSGIEKKLSINEAEVERNNQLKSNIPDSTTCPLCQNNITKDHASHVISEADKKISSLTTEIKTLEKEFDTTINKIKTLESEKFDLKKDLSNMENELIKLNNIEEKKQSIKKLVSNEKEIEKEILDLKNKIKTLENKVQEKEIVEDKYNKLFFELQELSSRTDENLNTTILYKEREIESINNILRNIEKDQSQLSQDVKRLSEELKNNNIILTNKKLELEELNKKFKKLFDERSQIQETIKKKNMQLVEKQNIVSRFDDAINNFRVNHAKVSAEKESLEFELQEFKDITLIQGSIQSLQERLTKSEQTLATIGGVNMRALETYDTIKVEYEKIQERVDHLQTEREEILNVISEIDKKKKKTFMKTFNSINDLFTNNFTQLSSKGKAFLEIENKEDIFEGGIGIAIKVGNGKYFDVTSMSGGEQTLLALSLIFAIQEYKPYAFYILDEIDAALDKRNAGLLANLLKKYIQKGQYIIISHNDEVISNADLLYGVSMNSGISKVLSLDVRENLPQTNTKE